MQSRTAVPVTGKNYTVYRNRYVENDFLQYSILSPLRGGLWLEHKHPTIYFANKSLSFLLFCIFQRRQKKVRR